MGKGIYAIIAFALGFIIAQMAKMAIGYLKKDKKGRPMGMKGVIKTFGKSGGMPSGHSASFSALSFFLGLTEGFNSIAFAITLSMTTIIVYDAVNVRFAVGQQGKLLNKIALNDDDDETIPQKLIEGHTMLQVVVGILIGLLIGYMVFIFYKGAI